MRILCVDDDDNCRMLYKEELAEEGYCVDTAQNGVEALRMIEESIIFNAPYDLVLLDIRMPVMDGINACIRIKEQWHELPVITNTAYGGYKQDFKTWGADGFIWKSADLNELKETIRRLIIEKRSGVQ